MMCASKKYSGLAGLAGLAGFAGFAGFARKKSTKNEYEVQQL